MAADLSSSGLMAKGKDGLELGDSIQPRQLIHA
jgi:hypothetical protein